MESFTGLNAFAFDADFTIFLGGMNIASGATCMPEGSSAPYDLRSALSRFCSVSVANRNHTDPNRQGRSETMQTLSRLTLITLSLSMLAFCLAAAPALAQEDLQDPYARTGVYIGATILGGSYLSNEDELTNTVTAIVNDTTTRNIEADPALGFDIYVGYRINKFFAVEAEFEMLPATDLDFSEDIEESEAVVFPPPPRPAQTGTSGTLAELESITGSFNVKAFLPVGRLQPFALVGVGVADIEQQDAQDFSVWVSETEVIGRFGGGADLYVTENVVFHFSVDYVLPGGSLDTFDYISYGAGIQYRF